MIPSDCTLDISNIFHSTTVVIEGSCLNKSEPTAVLRDVSARVHGGEVLAILGSKGSGKRALLDVIGKIMIQLQIFLDQKSFRSFLFFSRKSRGRN